MADNGKKIVFEGVDKTSQASESAKRGIVSLHTENIKGLKDINTLLKEQNTLLEQQKRLITSIASEGLSKSQASAVGQLTNKLFQTPERVNPEHIRSFSKILEGQMHIGSSGSMSEKLIQKVQELIDTNKLQHRETTAHHLKDDAETKKIMTGPLAFLGKEVVSHKSLERIEKLNEKSEKMFGGDGEKLGDKVKEDKEKELHLPHSIEGAIEKGLDKALKFIGAGAAAGGVIELGKDIFDSYAKRKGVLAGARSGEEAAFEISPLTGLVMSEYEKEARHIPGKRRSFEEKIELQSKQFGYAAITGALGNFGSAIDLGASSAQLAEIGTKVAKNLGRSASHNEAYSSLFVEKVFGVNSNGIESLSRYSKDEMDPKQLVASITDTFGGRVKTPEWADMLVKINQQQLNVLGSVDAKSTLSIMSSFQSNKNQLFQNAETLAPIMGGFNAALTQPGNDFSKARNFAVMSKMMPGASFFQIQRAMSKGIYGERGGEYMQGTMDMLKQQYGGDKEGLKTALLGTMGGQLTPEQIEQFVEGGYGGGSVKSGSNALSKVNKGLYSSRYTRDVASIKSAYAISPEAGEAAVENAMNMANGVMGKEELEKTGDNRSKLAVATGAAADKMTAVAKQAEIGAKLYKESAADMKKASENLKLFLRESRNGIRNN